MKAVESFQVTIFTCWERSGLKKLFVKWRTKEANVCSAHHWVTRISFHVTPVSSKVACHLMNDNTILKSLRFVCHLNVHSLLLADVKLNFTLAICQTKSLFMMFCFEWPKVVATVRKMFIGLSMVVLVFPKQMAGWKNAPNSGVPKWYPKWLWPWCPGITPLAQQELDVRRHFRSPFKRSRM